MNDEELRDTLLSEDLADEYASWFRCLADGTRVRILSFIAAADGPVTVGDMVDAIGRSQSTVSKHLQLLAEDEFVFLTRDGVRTLHWCFVSRAAHPAAAWVRTSQAIDGRQASLRCDAAGAASRGSRRRTPPQTPRLRNPSQNNGQGDRRGKSRQPNGRRNR